MRRLTLVILLLDSVACTGVVRRPPPGMTIALRGAVHGNVAVVVPADVSVGVQVTAPTPPPPPPPPPEPVIAFSRKDRPLARDKQKARRLFDERQKFYCLADWHFVIRSGSNSYEIARQINEQLFS